MTPLRQRMLEDMQIRHFTPKTQYTYLKQVEHFARYFGQRPEVLNPEDIRTYLIYLTNERQLASSSILTATAALRFVYGAQQELESRAGCSSRPEEGPATSRHLES